MDERVAVLGTGRMGRAIGGLAGRVGFRVRFGSRSAERARRVAANVPGAEGGDYGWAAQDAHLTVLVTEWAGARRALVEAGVRAGSVLIDVTNPESPLGPGLEVGPDTSGGEIVASWLPSVLVVKALNHIYAETLDEAPFHGGERPAAFVCGDDQDARDEVISFVRRCGLEPIDLGPLRAARFTEPASQLVRQLVRGMGWEPSRAALRLPYAHVPASSGEAAP